MVSWMYRDLTAQAVKGDVILVGLRSAKKFKAILPEVRRVSQSFLETWLQATALGTRVLEGIDNACIAQGYASSHLICGRSTETPLHYPQPSFLSRLI